MQAIVINACYGGFSLSRAAFLRLREMGNATALEETDYADPKNQTDDASRSLAHVDSYCRDIPRNDPQLVEIVRKMKSQGNGQCAKLRIVEIPDGADWEIEEYDGNEHIAEKHETWR